MNRDGDDVNAAGPAQSLAAHATSARNAATVFGCLAVTRSSTLSQSSRVQYPSITSLRVWVEDDWSTYQQPYDPLLRPTFASPSTVTLDLPWGTQTLRFPFEAVVWLRPPA